MKLPNGQLKVYSKRDLSRLSWEGSDIMAKQEKKAVGDATQKRAGDHKLSTSAMNFIFPGVGHFYTGRYYRGTLYASIALLGFATFAVFQPQVTQTNSKIKELRQRQRENLNMSGRNIILGIPLTADDTSLFDPIEKEVKTYEKKQKFAVNSQNVAIGLIVLSYAASFIDGLITSSPELPPTQEQKKGKQPLDFSFSISSDKQGNHGGYFHFSTYF